MLPRPVILTGLLGAAVAGPIMMDKAPEGWGASLRNDTTASAGQVQHTPFVLPSLARPADSQLQHNGSPIYRSPAPLEGSIVSVAEALRMDVTRQWVYSRWARKSTGLGDPELFGVRAPLVTGSQMTDLAGAISYYFDAEGVVQKLRFHGRTADTSQLIAIAQQRFGMQQRPGQPGEQLFQRVTRSGIESELRTRPAPVLWGTSPHSSFIVDMEVNRTGSGRFVNHATPQLDLPERVADAPVAASSSREASASKPAALASDEPQRETRLAENEADPGERRSFLGLTPGRLPPNRWPH